MKAIAMTRPGGPDVLALVDRPEPAPGLGATCRLPRRPPPMPIWKAAQRPESSSAFREQPASPLRGRLVGQFSAESG